MREWRFIAHDFICLCHFCKYNSFVCESYAQCACSNAHGVCNHIILEQYIQHKSICIRIYYTVLLRTYTVYGTHPNDWWWSSKGAEITRSRFLYAGCFLYDSFIADGNESHTDNEMAVSQNASYGCCSLLLHRQCSHVASMLREINKYLPLFCKAQTLETRSTSTSLYTTCVFPFQQSVPIEKVILHKRFFVVVVVFFHRIDRPNGMSRGCGSTVVTRRE